MAAAFIRALDGNADSTTLTLANFVVGSGDAANRIIIVGTTTDPDVTSIARGAQNFTKLISSASGLAGSRIAQLWYLVNPTESTTSIVVTVSPSQAIGAGAVLISGVNQTAPFNTYGSSGGNGSPSVTLYTTVANCIFVDVVGSESVQANPDNGTLRWTESYSFNESRGSTRTVTSSGKYAQTWGSGAGDWCMVVAALNDADLAGKDILPQNNLRPAIFKPGIAR